MTVSTQSVAALLDGTTPLNLRSGSTVSVTLDGGWSPYIQADITLPLPANVAPFDARNNHRVQVTTRQDWGLSAPVSVLSARFAGQPTSAASTVFAGLSAAQVTARYYQPFNTFGVRSPEIRTYDLLLRDRLISRSSATMTLRLTSDESLLIDRALVSATPFQPGTTDIRSIAIQVLARIGASLQPGTATGVVDADATEQVPGRSDWDYLAPMLQKANLRLWCDEQRRWWLEESQATQPGQFRIDAANAVEDDDDIERNSDDIYDAVVIQYRWTEAGGSSQTAYDVASTPGWTKAREFVYDDTRYPGAGAAANVLRRARGRGRNRTIRTVAQLTTSPGQPATITVGDDTQNGFVASVNYRWPDDEMTVTTRGLVDVLPTAWLFDNPGVAWNSVPAGTDWKEDV